MALFSAEDIRNWLELDLEVALQVANPLNASLAEREVRGLVTKGKYEDVEANKAAGDDEYDRIAQAEALMAFASYIGNRAGLRLSEKGGLVRDLGMVNQQTTIRQLLSQGELEEVQGRIRQQAKDILDDLIDASGTVWGI